MSFFSVQVYTHQVDIFSFGMLLYEAITLHIPYENLNGQQANQANEQGTRPPLTKKVFLAHWSVYVRACVFESL